MIIGGCFKRKGGFIPLHLDNDDHVTSLLSLGQDVEESGGRTYYVEMHPPKKSSGSKSSLLTIVKRVTYHHGNMQTGCYDKVLHGANHWINGQRGVINFSMQKNLGHFTQYGCRFYKQYVDARFPSGDYIAKYFHRDH